MIDNWQYYLYINDLDQDKKIHNKIIDIQYGSMNNLYMALSVGVKIQLLAKYINNIERDYEINCGTTRLQIIDKKTGIAFMFYDDNSQMRIHFPKNDMDVSSFIAAYNFGHISFMISEVIRLYKRRRGKNETDKLEQARQNMKLVEKAEQNMLNCFKIDKNVFIQNKYKWS